VKGDSPRPPQFEFDFEGPLLLEVERKPPAARLFLEARQGTNDTLKYPVVMKLQECEARDFPVSEFSRIEVCIALFVPCAQIRREVEPNLEVMINANL
jgi:hypothetical protein